MFSLPTSLNKNKNTLSQITAFNEFIRNTGWTFSAFQHPSGQIGVENNVHSIAVDAWCSHLESQNYRIIKHRSDILNTLIDAYDLKSYLEIGVRDGSNFRKIDCEQKTGVDPSLDYPDIEDVVYVTSDEFFSSLAPDKKYDLIFIDGLHLEHQVTRDIQNSLKYLTSKGIIVMHDCNPPTVHHAREDSSDLSTPAKGKWNGTTWKAYVRERCANKDIYACVVDIDWGCAIISPSGPLKQDLYKKDSLEECLKYEYMDGNRKELLNLISVDDFISMTSLAHTGDA
jgi:hypothetical protein